MIADLAFKKVFWFYIALSDTIFRSGEMVIGA
jgi:hypothetical protein